MKGSDTKRYRYVDLEKAIAWQTIGNDAPMTVPVNGYLAVYLSNASSFASCEGCLNSEGDVYFDKVNIRFTRGNLKQETHYYPFGLPMAGIGSSAMGLTPNRQKYQSNEYITDAGLNWMSFGARQYDPQIGRFLSVDPMASAGGQDMLSPYQAMGNDPVSGTDPGGLEPQANRLPDQNIPNVNPFVHAIVSWANPGFGGYSPEAIREMTPGASPDVDPMNLSYWYDHQVGSDGKVYTLYRDMDGNIISATAGDGNNNSGKVATNEEKSTDDSKKDSNPNADMHLSADGYALLADYEGPLDGSKGFHDGKYWVIDVGDGKKTIGLGYVITTEEEAKEYANGITPEQAYALMKGKVGGFENIVKGSINVALSQNEFDALVIMAYNHGKVYDNVRDAINGEATLDALQPLWLSNDWAHNRQGQLVEWPGLLNRRTDEFELYSTGDYIRNH